MNASYGITLSVEHYLTVAGEENILINLEKMLKDQMFQLFPIQLARCFSKPPQIPFI